MCKEKVEFICHKNLKIAPHPKKRRDEREQEEAGWKDNKNGGEGWEDERRRKVSGGPKAAWLHLSVDPSAFEVITGQTGQ